MAFTYGDMFALSWVFSLALISALWYGYMVALVVVLCSA